MHYPVSRGIALAFCLALPIDAQQAASTAPAPVIAPVLEHTPEHGIRGTRPGTERWIVHFKSRSFDLNAFRDAIFAHRPAAEVAALVTDLERSVIADQAGFVASAEALGGVVTQQWWLINAAAVEIDPARLPALRALPNLLFVQPDEVHEALILTATNAANHNADALQAAGHSGLGVTVGIMDTGQDENMNGTGRPHREYFVNGDINNTTGGGIGGSRLLINRQIGALIADDQHGHGTGVASISAGADWGTAAADDGHAPRAGIAGYSIANQVSGGGSSTATMATAWQSMAADRAQFNIVAANLSYGGAPSAIDASQQALDSAALNADILCCAAAGNSGPNAGSTSGSQGAANGLAVAAVNPNLHTIASFSSRGPLSGDTARFYPDIAACGVSTVMGARDNEGGNFTASGTSMASPQVAGAATQLRGRFPILTAIETKVILLASSNDIATQNGGLDRNAFGMGFLKNDRAHALTAAAQFGSATVSTANPVHTFTIPATAGQTFAIAISWHRLALASNTWSDLNLEVRDANNNLLASSSTTRNLYEMVRLFVPSTGNLTVRTTAVSISGAASQPFSFAWTDSPGARLPGSADTYGAGCSGSGTSPAICASVNPNGGTLANNVRASEYGYALTTATAISVTAFEIFSQSTTGSPVTVAAAIYGTVAGVPGTAPLLSTTVTIGGTPGFYRGTFAVPVNIPAGNFYIGVNHTAQTTRLSQLDVGATGGAYFRSTFGSGTWSRSTLITQPSVKAICGSGTVGAVPNFVVAGTPKIGASSGYGLSLARPSTAAVLLFGVSNTVWAGGALPFSLAGIGANGCSLLASTEITAALTTNTQGTANLNLAFPNQAALVGTRFFSQFLVVDPAANTFGLATSNGVSTLVGN